jgi:hypothetical protein
MSPVLRGGERRRTLNDFEFDIDRETVRLDGEWLSAADLTERIRSKIQAGDFRVSKLSSALEALEALLARLDVVTVRVPPEVAETYQKLARFEDTPITQIYRRALVHYLATEEAATRLLEANRPRSAGPV